MSSIFSLQNGSDIRGVAMEDVPGEKVNLTPILTGQIAKSFAYYLSKKTDKPVETLKIAIGRDSRISGPSLLSAATEGLLSLGVFVFDCGLASTPSLFMATQFNETDCDGSIMLTASHLPFHRNGMKFFTKTGGLDKKDIFTILEKTVCIVEKPPLQNEKSGQCESLDLLGLYSDHLVNFIRKQVQHPQHFETPLKGLKIVVDAGNGAGGFFAERILKPLGANTNGSQFLDPDGFFPNHIPNPEDDTAMKAIQEATISNQADLGIIFDTDVDRAAVVDKSGKIIHRNRLIALMSAILLEDNPGTTIVTDSVTSQGLTLFIQAHGGKHHRFKRGYKNVINESKRLNDSGIHSALAIETSGHGALKDNYFLDDGAFLVTKILVSLAHSHMKNENFVACLESLKEPLESISMRLAIKGDHFTDTAKAILESFSDFPNAHEGYRVVSPNYEGVRISTDNSDRCGWFLIRLSLHDPLLPLQIESDVHGGTAMIAKDIYAHLCQFENLDLSAFSPFL